MDSLVLVAERDRVWRLRLGQVVGKTRAPPHPRENLALDELVGRFPRGVRRVQYVASQNAKISILALVATGSVGPFLDGPRRALSVGAFAPMTRAGTARALHLRVGRTRWFGA